MLLDGLPAEAAVWRDDPAVFRRQDELLAVVIEEIGRHLQVTAQLTGVKASALPKRTDVRPRKPRQLTTDRAAIQRFFARRR